MPRAMRRRRGKGPRHRSAKVSAAGSPALTRTGTTGRGGGPGPSDASNAADRPRAAASEAERVTLAWALDRDGARAFVGELDARTRRDRGPFRCIGCGDELLARLGTVRARHFAHRPGSTCALTRPETALHLNAKERLLALCSLAFSGERRVVVLARCPSCRRETPQDLAETGDAAVAEGAAGGRRCDVLVTRAGAAALALEVKVSHAVDGHKAAALAAAGLPAIELDAREPWEREDEDGVAIVPARSLGFPRCPACETARRAELDRGRGADEAERAELESYRARGLLGPRPGPPLDAPPTLSREDAAKLRFRCPECGASSLAVSGGVARHACGPAGARPVAWRGYDGAVVALAWWRR